MRGNYSGIIALAIWQSPLTKREKETYTAMKASMRLLRQWNTYNIPTSPISIRRKFPLRRFFYYIVITHIFCKKVARKFGHVKKKPYLCNVKKHSVV